MAADGGPAPGDTNPTHVDTTVEIVGSRRDNPKLPKDFGDLTPQDQEPVKLDPIVKDLPDPQRVKDFTEGKKKTARRVPGMIYVDE